MKVSFIPKTFSGKCSVILIIATPILFYLGVSFVGFYESVSAGKTIPHDIIVRPGVALPMLTGFACGIAAFFTGIIGIIKKKDYSILVFLSYFHIKPFLTASSHQNISLKTGLKAFF